MIRNYRGETPLHKAAAHGFQGIVKKLIEAGAVLVTQTNDGDTALHTAAQNGHLNVVKLLSEAKDGKRCLKIKGMNDKDPLQQAQENNKTEVVEYLQ